MVYLCNKLALLCISQRFISETIVICTFKGEKGVLQWNDDWISFLDTMLQITILSSEERSLQLPTAIRKIALDPQRQLEAIIPTDTNTCGKSIPTMCDGSLPNY